MGNDADAQPAQQTPLYPVTSKLVRDEREKLRRDQITPWAFLNSGKVVRVVDFYGREIRYQGVRFEGSPRAVFWGRYIEPFLEDIAFRMIDHTLALCQEKGQEPKPALIETGELLKRLVRDAYEAMANIDQRLRGAGFPDRVGKRNVERNTGAMERFIDSRVAGELRMWKRPGRLKLRGSLVEWILGGMGLIVAVVAGYFTIIPVLDQTRKDFQALQPDVQLVRANCFSAAGSYSALLKLQNNGKTPASDGTITLDGRPGEVELGTLLPVRPGFNDYERSIEIDRESQIRTTKMDDARLWIRYRDKWGYSYEVSYPVLQKRGDHGLFDLEIQRQQPRLKRPAVSFWRMRTILQETPG